MNPNEAAVQTWIVVSPIEHDLLRYEPGTVFPFSDPAIIAPLRAAKALKLREEIEAAEQLAADRARLEGENAELRQQLAEAIAKANSAGKKSPKSASGDDTPQPPAL